MYLGRCQVDTPIELVESIWNHVSNSRRTVGKVVDFGAGDGRFARYGSYREYVGYEVDSRRFRNVDLPQNAKLRYRCAFSDVIDDADVCIGNPPFVRNQDLPQGWREQVAQILLERTGVALSGLSNAWQYFFLLSLASLRPDGLSVLIVPFEWVSRPSARHLREYILENHWSVRVYRLIDTAFNSVLTTSSVTIIDKADHESGWSYFEESTSGTYAPLQTPSGASDTIEYTPGSKMTDTKARAMRGLSPGTQRVLTLNEGERVHYGLRRSRDVVPCVTTLRHVPPRIQELNREGFREYYVEPGRKCWLIRTDADLSQELEAYLSSVPEAYYQTSTCLGRSEWWKFRMPPIPKMFVAMSFIGSFPKTIINRVGARAVGGVYGIFNVTDVELARIAKNLPMNDLSHRVVAHSQGLRKIEVNQLNTLIAEALGPAERAGS